MLPSAASGTGSTVRVPWTLGRAGSRAGGGEGCTFIKNLGHQGSPHTKSQSRTSGRCTQKAEGVSDPVPAGESPCCRGSAGWPDESTMGKAWLCRSSKRAGKASSSLFVVSCVGWGVSEFL